MAQILVDCVVVSFGYSNTGSTVDRLVPFNMGFFSSSPLFFLSGIFDFVTDRLISNRNSFIRGPLLLWK